MSYRKKRAAFSLIELLVVISIILIASSIIFIGSSGGDGAKLSTAQRVVSGIAQGARGQAIMKNAPVRLIIYSENNADLDPDRMLRFFGIIYQDPEDSSQWRAATQGDFLPEGIYFDPDLSDSKGWPRSTMSLEYPRQRAPEGTGPQFYYYEFNSNGTMASAFENTWLVLRGGLLGRNLEIDFPQSVDEDRFNLKTALIFRRAGTTTLVDNPEAIN